MLFSQKRKNIIVEPFFSFFLFFKYFHNLFFLAARSSQRCLSHSCVLCSLFPEGMGKAVSPSSQRERKGLLAKPFGCLSLQKRGVPLPFPSGAQCSTAHRKTKNKKRKKKRTKEKIWLQIIIYFPNNFLSLVKQTPDDDNLDTKVLNLKPNYSYDLGLYDEAQVKEFFVALKQFFFHLEDQNSFVSK